MPTLNFETPDNSSGKSKNKLRRILLVILSVGTIFLGSTFAANINLNSGGPVEFGQGVTQAAACDNSIQVTPYSSFVNSNSTVSGTFRVNSENTHQLRIGDISKLSIGTKFSSPELGSENVITDIGAPQIMDGSFPWYPDFPNGSTYYIITFTGGSYGGPLAENITFQSGGFKFDSVKLTNLDTTNQVEGSMAGCKNQSFSIRVYGKSGSALAEYSISDNGEGFTSTDGTVTNINYDSTDSSVTLKLNSPSVESKDVYRITLETNPQSWRSWIVANALNQPGLLAKIDSNGMGFRGDASNNEGLLYPYITKFSVPGNQKLELNFTFYHQVFCSDQGIAIFRSDATPRWIWESNNPNAIAVQFNCSSVEVNGPNNSTGGGNLIDPNYYQAKIVYDPNLNQNKLHVEIKTLSGDIIYQTYLDDEIPGSGSYKVGFSADLDLEDTLGPDQYSYFKDLTYKIG